MDCCTGFDLETTHSNVRLQARLQKRLKKEWNQSTVKNSKESWGF